MKRLLTIALVIFAVATLSAQEPYTAYCSMSGASYSQLDYGQKNLAKNTLVDEAGNSIYFSSFIGMLNYMSERGWEYVGHYTEVDSSTVLDEFKISSKTKWVFKKEVASPDEITAGLLTRRLYLERQGACEQ